jgi:C-terminal processing protease CtpA/Prc
LGWFHSDWSEQAGYDMTDSVFNQEIRQKIFENVVSTAERKLYDPGLNGVEWHGIAAAQQSSIVSAQTREEFETRMNNLIRELRVSHAGFFSEKRPLAPANMAIGATFHNNGKQWIFQDVHPGGPAYRAGVRPGDTLLAVGGQESRPPKMLVFGLGESVTVDLERRRGERQNVQIRVPASKKKNRPMVEIQPASWTTLPDGIGYLKIAMFPGLVGIDLARELDRAVGELKADRLIIDLRGNSGGGMGCLRVMSYLTPHRLPVGYSVTRRDMERPQFDKNRLPKFDRIPDGKTGLIPLIFRFALHGRSVAVFTENQGPQSFHGRVAILVNEHTASSSEMITAFAIENGLATVIGSRTAGRLLGGNSFKVGYGYRIAIPVVAYRTWQGARLEGKGIEPNVAAPYSPEAFRDGIDTQLNVARDVLLNDNQRMSTGEVIQPPPSRLEAIT